MKKISLKAYITVLIIFVISVNFFRLSGNPSTFTGVYTGLVLSSLGILLIGFISNRYLSAISGGLIIGLGYLFRQLYPIIPKIGKKEVSEVIEIFKPYNEFLSNNLIILIIAGILFGFIAGRIGEILKEDRSNKFSTVKISYMAIFIAISVMINSLRIGSISFGGFPIILSGYLLGPIPGFIVGAVADIVSFIIRPSAFPFNPIFTLTSALTGALPVLVNNLLGERYPKYTFIKILIGVIIGQMITSVILVPIFSVILYGKNTFWVLASKAFLKQAVSIPVYAILVAIINDRLNKVIDFNKAFK